MFEGLCVDRRLCWGGWLNGVWGKGGEGWEGNWSKRLEYKRWDGLEVKGRVVGTGIVRHLLESLDHVSKGKKV
jgi:hypothetical protein